LQRELAERLGVTDGTIYLWENNRVRSSLAQIPKVIEFLGRDPFEIAFRSLRDTIREYRRVHGLSQKKLADQLAVDQTTLAAWERGEHRPSSKLILHLNSFLKL